jgi:hypothetical protein
MTDETTGDEISDEQRAKDEETRRAVRIQLEETGRLETEQAASNLAGLSDSQFRRTVRNKWGFDPGV